MEWLELSYVNHSNKICIGYFAADFREHPLSYLIAEMIELHDRNKFKVIGFSYGENDNSAIRQRLLNSFDEFIDVSTFSDQQISEFSRTKKIDIAVDLNGFSGGTRISIFSNRAAPIQVNWLGYPGTVGNYMDYIIADKVIIPHSHQRFYFEKIAYLPNTYIVDDSKRTISSKKFTKQELGLPEDAFIFCCFNNHYKYNQQIIDSWS
ncbi:hypothetical protein EBS02_10585, partial [bacterium]|nr:hypothetical protein [bacterium]